ncbi:MAG: 16S rRNA (cytidine(1402)-2'-O)-methyltransferase [Geodermatophilaceae bacterium]|nr:16S rRNA (cytidine(1402)-2'-O)-methyltransferase [Geodermatophilaceae bacterium]
MSTGEDGAAPGRLIVAGAPLGQTGDVSPRLREVLGTAGVIAAEDTRRLRRLAADLGVTVSGRIVSYYDAVEGARVPGLLAALDAGSDVVLISDGGMPAVSDPGYRLVRAAAEAGYVVTSLPGPSAVTTALAVSGLPSDRFCFEGFLPRTAHARTRRLAELREEPRTMVFFEAPHRIAATLDAMCTGFGADRPAVACRELTKTYEEIVRGDLAELHAWAEAGLRGELTLVVGGWAPQRPAGGPDDFVAEVRSREAAGAVRKAAIAESAKHFGVPKREVYDAVIAARPPKPS